MDNLDRNFAYDFLKLSNQDIQTLEEICYELTGEGLNIKDKMRELWNDVTTPSKNGEKQKDWKEIGSDQIIEQWATDLYTDLESAVGDMLLEDEETYAMLELADEILSKLIDI